MVYRGRVAADRVDEGSGGRARVRRRGALNVDRASDDQRAVRARCGRRIGAPVFVSPRDGHGVHARVASPCPSACVAIDEAHCISHWGPTSVRSTASSASSATRPRCRCTPSRPPPRNTCAPTSSGARAGRPARAGGHLDRPNLSYRVLPRRDEIGQLEGVIRRHPARRASCTAFAARRRARGRAALARRSRSPAIAGISSDDRRRGAGGIPVRAARRDSPRWPSAWASTAPTCASSPTGMPKSSSTISQEPAAPAATGSASECVLFFDPGDFDDVEALLERGHAEPRRAGSGTSATRSTR